MLSVFMKGSDDLDDGVQGTAPGFRPAAVECLHVEQLRLGNRIPYSSRRPLELYSCPCDNYRWQGYTPSTCRPPPRLEKKTIVSRTTEELQLDDKQLCFQAR